MTSAQQSMLSRMGFVCEYGYASGPELLRGGGDNNPDAEAADTIANEVQESQEQEEEEKQEEQQEEQQKEQDEQTEEEEQQQSEQQKEQQQALEDFIAPGGASHDQIQESRERMLLRAAFHVR